MDAVLREACADCFNEAALRYPEHFEEALSYLDAWKPLESGEFAFLTPDWENGPTIDQVLKKPTAAQLCEVFSTLPKVEDSGDRSAGDRMVAQTLAAKFPDLVKTTSKARAFFGGAAPKQKSAAKPGPRSQGPPTVPGSGEQKVIQINLAWVLVAVVGALIIYWIFF